MRELFTLVHVDFASEALSVQFVAFGCETDFGFWLWAPTISSSTNGVTIPLSLAQSMVRPMA